MEERLTKREMEIVELLAEGLTNPQIADRLVLSRHTVKTHVQTVYSKLGINNRIKLAFWLQGKK